MMRKKILISGIHQLLSLSQRKINGVELNEVLEIKILIHQDHERGHKLMPVVHIWVAEFLKVGEVVVELKPEVRPNQ